MTQLVPQRWHAFWQLARLDRPIGSLLLLWPTLWALWLASAGQPSWHHLLVFVLGVFVMRSAGCVINDFADRRVDGHVKRTAARPLPSGRVTPKEALRFFWLLVALAVGLALTLSPLVWGLAVVGLGLAIVYPFMKRVTHLPQLVLALAFSWAIPMAWAAAAGELTAQTWWLFAANCLWTVAYDTQYAMVDRDDDLKIGVKSTAILFGRHDRLIIGLLQLATLVCLAQLGWMAALAWPYWWSLAAAGGLFVYQQRLTWRRERQACFVAFLNNNWVGLLLFAGLALSFLFQGR
ncbi:4-hydroxybenzoate octaprenyltransferase [Pseudaeromonas sp. ZJS20]|uniref:4-hydroxybenzoate octaprenyltransferase n=1 Tax=Pseudaeromonas aegiceratis TaxID=3153928 RepID=UPI00390CB858